jgi:hypothetical protein
MGGLISDSFIYTGRDSWLNRPTGGGGRGGIKLDDEDEGAVADGEQA